MKTLIGIIAGFALAVITLNALIATEVIVCKVRRDLPAAERRPINCDPMFQPCECCGSWPPRLDLDRRPRPPMGGMH